MLELRWKCLPIVVCVVNASARGIIWIFIEISEGTHLSPLCNEIFREIRALPRCAKYCLLTAATTSSVISSLACECAEKSVLRRARVVQ